jgi:hypothetical protein
MKLLIMQFSPAFCYFRPLEFKYYPQLPVYEDLASVFFKTYYKLKPANSQVICLQL